MNSSKLLLEELNIACSANIAQDRVCKLTTNYQFSDLTALIRQYQNTENELFRLLTILNRFLSLCDVDWLLKTEGGFVEFVAALREVGGVPSFKDREDCGFQSSDFVNVAERAALVMPVMECLVTQVSAYWHSLKDQDKETIKIGDLWRNLLAAAVMLSAEHTRDNLWSNEASCACSASLQQILVTCSQTENFTRLLNNTINGESVFYKILTELKLKLTKSSWKNNPAAVCTFHYLLLLVRSPALSHYLEDVLPPSLLMIDDFQLDYRLAGVACLQHIIENASSTELLWFGRAEVIFSALNHLTYTHEADLISAVHPCLRLILQVLIKDPLKLDEAGEESKWDAVMSQLLRDMEFEDKLVERRAYAAQLQSYIKLLGLGILKHMQRLIRVLTSYLEIDDGPEDVARLRVIDVLHELIEQAQPRMHAHCLRLSQSLVRCLYDLSSDVESIAQLPVAKQQLASRCVQCMTVLCKCCPSEMSAIISELLRVSRQANMNKILIGWLSELNASMSLSLS